MWDLTSNIHMQSFYDILLKEKKKQSLVDGILEKFWYYDGTLTILILFYRR